MKNLRMESIIRAAKAYARHRALSNNGFGVETETWFDGLDPEDHFWDEDIAMRLGQQIVLVRVTHPRRVCFDTIRDIAHSFAGATPDCDMFDIQTIQYKRVGNSRKRVASVTTETGGNHAWNCWFSKYDLYMRELCKEGITCRLEPSIEVIQNEYGRIVNVCMPADIRSEEAAGKIGVMIRGVLMSDNPSESLKALFPDYAYTQEDWKKDMERKPVHG